MEKIDYSKITPEEVKKLSPEQTQEYIEFLQSESSAKDGLIKEQAEQIKSAEAVKHETQPVVHHTIDKQKVTVRVNLKKFNYLNEESGMWELKTLKHLEKDANLVAALIKMKSNVVTVINAPKKAKK